MNDWLTLPLETQVSLASGYMAYLLAYAESRRNHHAADTVFLSFVFGVLALVVLKGVAGTGISFLAIPLAFIVPLVAAIAWRKALRRWTTAFMNHLRIHQDDGMPDAWTALLAALPRQSVSQISVHTTDGRVLYCNDARRHAGEAMRGLYLGSDGGIVMMVEEEEFPDGRTETRDGLSDPDWGTRMTFVPPSAVLRVNLRFTKA